MPKTSAELRADLERAERALFSVSMSDDFAFTNGSYDAAKRVRDEVARELAEAEKREGAG